MILYELTIHKKMFYVYLRFVIFIQDLSFLHLTKKKSLPEIQIIFLRVCEIRL